VAPIAFVPQGERHLRLAVAGALFYFHVGPQTMEPSASMSQYVFAGNGCRGKAAGYTGGP
jgi:hypothetical protein